MENQQDLCHSDANLKKKKKKLFRFNGNIDYIRYEDGCLLCSLVDTD
jgi:hypothetical protein